MTYEAIETAIVERIQPFVPQGVQVVKLPEREDDMSRPFGTGKVTVAYKASRYGEPGSNSAMLRSTDHIVQLETLNLEVAIQSRFLRQPSKGIYNLWDMVRRAIVGFKPADCNRLYAKDFEYFQYEDGLFTYVATLECTRLLVQEVAEENQGTLNGVSFDYNIVTAQEE